MLTPRLSQARGAYGVVLEALEAQVATEVRRENLETEWVLKAGPSAEEARPSAGPASAGGPSEARGIGAQVAAALVWGELLVPTVDVKCYVPLSGQAAVVEDLQATMQYKEGLLKL